MGEDAPRRVACFCCETMKLGSQAYRGARRRLQDIDLPIGIRAVRYIEPDSGEPVSFITRPWLAAIAEAKPPPSEKEALVAVDVEALLLRPSSGPRSGFLFGRLEHVAMWKDVALHSHSGSVEDPILQAFKRFTGMTDEIRVPWLQSSAIERQAQQGHLAFKEPMKGHRKMRLQAIRELD